MKENRRKCFKCGRSPENEPNVKLYRFPKPGNTNVLRCELWAKYCFPDKPCTTEFQRKLYSEHRMLCDKHFKPTSFIDFENKLLHRSAVPEEVKRVELHIPCNTAAHDAMTQKRTNVLSNKDDAVAGPSHSNVLMEKTNLIAFGKTVEKVDDPHTPTSEAAHDAMTQKRTNVLSNKDDAVAGPSHSNVLMEKTNLIAFGKTVEKVDDPRTPTSEAAHDAMTQKRTNIPSNKDDAVAGPSHSNVLMEKTNLIASGKTVEKVDDLCTPTSEAITDKEKFYRLKCRKALQKICQLRNRIKKLSNDQVLKELEKDKYVTYLSKKLTPTLALLLQGEIKNFKRKENGRRWSREQKITALRIYKRSPTCYNLLRRLIILPSPSCLKKLLQQFNLKVGINEKIFQMLKKIIEKQDSKDNEYILTFDEMAIKKHLLYNSKEDHIEGYQDHSLQGRTSEIASYALVFMLCGIRKQLKQPVAFYLSGSTVTADRLSALIKEVLHHCFEAKINISATVCDMDGVNKRALSLLGATAQNPNFKYMDHDIVSLFDVPHLLKCFRNLFLKYNIKHKTNITSGDKIGEGIAKWSHINQFYEIDNQNANFVFAPKLRAEHINPNTKQKMRVKLAAQVLSHSVAAGMYAKIAQGELPTEATVTADLIADIDNLFDCLNSDTPDQRGGKRHSTNMTEKTPHLNHLKKMKHLFQNIQFIGCRNKPPSVDGWVWTLNGVEMLWKNLKNRNPQLRSLSTRKLQQDPLENLFGCIRGNCGSNTSPTAGQFIAALKTAVLNRLATADVRGTNCEADKNDAILNKFKTLLYNNTREKEKDDLQLQILEETVENKEENQENIKDIENEEENVEILCGDNVSEIQACAYVSGYMIRKISQKYNCNECLSNILAKDKALEHLFVEMKEYEPSKTSLRYASTEFIQCVESCSTSLNNFLEKNAHLKYIKNECFKILNNNNFGFLKCKKHKNMVMKFMKLSVFHICIKRFCTVQNRKYVEAASAIALKKKISILKHL